MPLHDIKADNVRTSSTYVQIFESDRNRVRNDVREQTFDEMRPFSLRLWMYEPWILKQSFADHYPIGTRKIQILHDIIVTSHIPIADNRNVQSLFQDPDLLQISRPIPSFTWRLTKPSMKSYPSTPRTSQAFRKRESLSYRITQPDFRRYRYRERMCKC